ncbi:hypothetical protein TD95_004088 [Thielaviopsis punctulata]|uniref:Biogenesis of lysosome-related organelles complex 1 subunit KXD1 n=1 Tax=Thielaviopsis punctulata TaxID=72032 RepID=A0A0F4ZK37_9PEZI|nr:hypothetical protein TD95_004088 [Thielaviopsis punctulata]
MTTQYSSSYVLPMHVPQKNPQYDSYQPTAYSVSPPEEEEEEDVYSTTSSSASYSLPSYTTLGHYDYDAGAPATGVDFHEYMHERVSAVMDPLPMDRSMVTQAKTSALLNDKQRQLKDLQKQAAAQLVRSRERYKEGLRDAREVRQELEWTQQQVQALKSKAQRKHSKEYAKARARYPSPENE